MAVVGSEVENTFWDRGVEGVENVGLIGLIGLLGLVGIEPLKASWVWRRDGTGGRLFSGGLLNPIWETIERGLGLGGCLGGGRRDTAGPVRGLDNLSWDDILELVRCKGDEEAGGNKVGVDGKEVEIAAAFGMGKGEVGGGMASKSRMIPWDRISELLNPFETGAFTLTEPSKEPVDVVAGVAVTMMRILINGW